MFAQLIDSPISIVALVLLILGTLLIVTGIVALVRAQVGSFILQVITGLLIFSLGATSGLIAVGIQGYQALTREETVASITVAPVAPQRFNARFKFADGRTSNYVIAGDEIYVDAHILKWQPIANIMGLHTSYELDRVGGRYREIEQERSAERTLYPLKQDKPVNLFELRLKNPFLSLLFDAKYGSATFIPVTQAAELELKISTTGLLMRELTPSAK